MTIEELAIKISELEDLAGRNHVQEGSDDSDVVVAETR